MSGVKIYLEGGGDALKTKRSLRQGMNRFLGALKDAARGSWMHWSVVPCGSRGQAFRHWSKDPEDSRYPIRVLLVDAEGPVQGRPVEHLGRRDGWTVADADEARVHTMVQTMETWIVADLDALQSYYGQGFAQTAFPAAVNLEATPKQSVATALRAATERTQKGAYHKTKHAPDLLARMDPDRVRSRCPACDHLFRPLTHLIRTNGVALAER